MTKTTEILKKCSKCGIEKQVSEFYERRDECKECRNKYQKEYRKANTEKRKEYLKTNDHKIKKQKKKYRKTNADKLKKQEKKYREANTKRVKKYQKKYQKANTESLSDIYVINQMRQKFPMLTRSEIKNHPEFLEYKRMSLKYLRKSKIESIK